MSLFKKSNRKIKSQRVRLEDSDEDKSDKNVNQISTNGNQSKPINNHLINKSVVKNSDKYDEELDEIYGNKSKTKPTNSKLSFHDEEEDCDVFKVKKSSYSRRLAKQKDKHKKSKDLKKDIKKDNDLGLTQNKTKTSDELKVVWIKSEEINKNPEIKEDLKIFSGDQIEGESDEEEDEYKSNEPFHHFRGALERGVIPDAKTIYALKKQRQMARDIDEFIPLDVDDKYDDNSSRIIRDDNNDKSDDEEDEDDQRISFAINKDNIEREKAREAFLLAQEEEEEDNEKEESEDELERWEREQIKKGVRMPSIQMLSQEQASNRAISGQFSRQTLFSDNLQVVNMDIDKPVKHKKSSSIPSSIQNKNRSNVTIEDIREKIRNKLSVVKESLEFHERQIVNITVDMNASQEVINDCKDSAPKLATQYELYQNISRYVSGLFGCLNEKIPEIRKLEEKSLKLFKSRSDKFILRRQQDVRDQNEECSVLAKRVQSGSGMIGNTSYYYDFGGDNLKRLRATEREGRRLRRRMARQNALPTLKHRDGMSSDDEEAESETIAYYEERDKIEEESKELFSDVLEEYSSLKFVTKNFEEWKLKSYTSYKDAYVSHCLPRLLGPFVVYELLNWNPFEERSKCNDLEDFCWFESLLFYGISKSKKDSNLSDEHESDLDFNLIPAIIERIILPRFTDLIENLWDPLSTKQTNQLVRLISKWAKDFPTVSSRSKHLQTLIHKIALRISRSLDEDVYIPQLLPQEVLENRTNPLALNVINFYQRQFWSAVKLFRNIISWQGIISDPVLQELALDRLLNRYLLFAIVRTLSYSDSIHKCQEIVLTLPRLWCDTKFPQISQLNQLLQQLLERNSDPLMIAEIVRLQNSLSPKNT